MFRPLERSHHPAVHHNFETEIVYIRTFDSSGLQADDGYVEVAETCSCDIQINAVYFTDYLPS
jgi:hypothetical protein